MSLYDYLGKRNCADFLIHYAGHLLKNTLEAKGIFPTPISLDNQTACRYNELRIYQSVVNKTDLSSFLSYRALLVSSREYTDAVITIIAVCTI
jgi:hypothetical protein